MRSTDMLPGRSNACMSTERGCFPVCVWVYPHRQGCEHDCVPRRHRRQQSRSPCHRLLRRDLRGTQRRQHRDTPLSACLSMLDAALRLLVADPRAGQSRPGAMGAWSRGAAGRCRGCGPVAEQEEAAGLRRSARRRVNTVCSCCCWSWLRQLAAGLVRTASRSSRAGAGSLTDTDTCCGVL